MRRRTNPELEDRSANFTLFSRGEQDIRDMASSCRDRTREFLTVVKSKKENGLFSEINMKGKERERKRNVGGVHANYSNFMDIAKQISHELSSSFEKLEKLTLLAKKKSLFDDKSYEINELTYILKTDINNLNSDIARLQAMCKKKGDNEGKHIQKHSNVIVCSLQSKLAEMSSGFKNVLEVRTASMKQQNERVHEFSDSSPTPLPATANSMLLNDDIAINMDSTPSAGGYTIQNQMLTEDSYLIENRANTMQSIESTIVELSSIFTQLAEMVKGQEELVTRIDANIEETELNVSQAHSELLKYFQSVTSNRMLMIKVFAILIIFFVIFVVFVA